MGNLSNFTCFVLFNLKNAKLFFRFYIKIQLSLFVSIEVYVKYSQTLLPYLIFNLAIDLHADP